MRIVPSAALRPVVPTAKPKSGHVTEIRWSGGQFPPTTVTVPPAGERAGSIDAYGSSAGWAWTTSIDSGFMDSTTLDSGTTRAATRAATAVSALVYRIRMSEASEGRAPP